VTALAGCAAISATRFLHSPCVDARWQQGRHPFFRWTGVQSRPGALQIREELLIAGHFSTGLCHTLGFDTRKHRAMILTYDGWYLASGGRCFAITIPRESTQEKRLEPDLQPPFASAFFLLKLQTTGGCTCMWSQVSHLAAEGERNDLPA
jgi:hypothetical protein